MTSPPQARSARSRLRSSILKQPLALAGVLLLVSWLVVLLFAPHLTPYTTTGQDLAHRLEPPSPAHPLGTDQLGRDVLARVMSGGRVSIPVGLAVVLVGGLLGTALGALAGYWGGPLDNVLMGINEVFQAFPTIVLAMVIAAALGPSLWNATLALILAWWPGYARLVRGLVLKIKQEEYVEAARALGAGGAYVLLRAILPNAWGQIVVMASLDLGNAVIAFAGLSFLGLGAVPPEPEWGRMVAEGVKVFDRWWIATFPGLAILSVALAVNFVGDALRDWTDPRALRT